MDDKKQQEKEKFISKQLKIFSREEVCYKAYAKLLKKILDKGSAKYTYNGIVQTRAKAVASFAEKSFRKPKDNPMYDFTDLCGGRVICGTLQEVHDVCTFVETYLTVDWDNSEDKKQLLSKDKFGYLSVHYIIQIPDDIIGKLELLDDTDKDSSELSNQELLEKVNQPKESDAGKEKERYYRKAEIQIRTCLQHAWADTTHDRLYKTAMTIPASNHRDANRIAALLEEADNLINKLGSDIDKYADHYTAYLNEESLTQEISLCINLINVMVSEPSTQIKQTEKLLGLYHSKSRWDDILNHDVSNINLENSEVYNYIKGVALCRKNLKDSKSDDFNKGIELLTKVAKPVEISDASICNSEETCLRFLVDELYKTRSNDKDYIRAAAMGELAWAEKQTSSVDRQEKARDIYYQAHLLDTENPYLFTSFLWLQLEIHKNTDFVIFAWSAIDNAISNCKKHIELNIDLVQTYFTQGSLYFLQGRYEDAQELFCQGISYCKNECELKDWVDKWRSTNDTLKRSNSYLQQKVLNIFKMLVIACASKEEDLSKREKIFKDYGIEILYKKEISDPLLIVAGGTAEGSLKDNSYSSLLKNGLTLFKGTICSGGTTAGVPGIIGDIAAEGSSYELLSYLPSLNQTMAQIIHPAYTIAGNSNSDMFSIAEPLQYWIDFIALGKNPSDITLLGINGGEISSFEYLFAVALGARVGLIEKSGRAVDDIEYGKKWKSDKIVFVPKAVESIATFLLLSGTKQLINEKILDTMAKAVHMSYLKKNNSQEAWDELDDNYKSSNIEQVSLAQFLLKTIGIVVSEDIPEGVKLIKSFEGCLTTEEIELLSTLEHGRWVLEKKQKGYVYGPVKDDSRKTHHCVVPWGQLPEEERRKDKDAVMAWPEIFESVGLKLYRKN